MVVVVPTGSSSGAAVMETAKVLPPPPPTTQMVVLPTLLAPREGSRDPPLLLLGASVRATKSLEIIEGSLVAIGEAVAIARASITWEMLPFGTVILILF